MQLQARVRRAQVQCMHVISADPFLNAYLTLAEFRGLGILRSAHH